MMIFNSINLTYSQNIILSNCSHHFEQNNIIRIVAPNGYGKTTLFKSIVNLKTPSSGHIEINDQTIKKDRVSFLQSIFFLESSSKLYSDFTALQMIEYIKHLWKSSENVNDLIDRLQITSYKDKKLKNVAWYETKCFARMCNCQ